VPAQQSALSIGLLLSAVAFGFRHGIDWDHIAAITDITASQESPRKGVILGTLYAVGHAVVVLVIGIVAILVGEGLPNSVDKVMGRVVGVTLLLLGIYVFYALIRYRGDFRMRSRWMLLFSLARRGLLWIREHMHQDVAEEVEHEHEHATGIHHDHESHALETEVLGHSELTGRHRHVHKHSSAADPFMNYGRGTSVVIGMLHGIGIETPTQVLIFLAAVGAGAASEGFAVLALFLLGLFAANTLVTVSAAYGYLAARKRSAIYIAVSALTGVVSIVIGVLFILGKEAFVPAFFAG